MATVILASGSASRRALLEGAGIAARSVKPNVDEDTLKLALRAEGMSVRDQAMQLAEAKAENGAPVWRHVSRPKLSVRTLSDQFIEAYIEACGDALLSTVGAYQLEGMGSQIFSKIEGDYFSILGLPLLPLLDYLRVRDVLQT